MTDGVGPAGGSPLRGEHLRLFQAAEALEAVFFRQMLQAMRDATPASGLAEESAGEKAFRSMFDDEISRRAVAQNDHGLASALYRQLSRHLPPEETAAAVHLGPPEATDVTGS
jgi:Rod binding domain-containing protein